jgi:hypothetical protein
MFEQDRLSRTPPPQAVLQQTASTQKPKAHCEPLEQGEPVANRASWVLAIGSDSPTGAPVLQPARMTSHPVNKQ